MRPDNYSLRRYTFERQLVHISVQYGDDSTSIVDTLLLCVCSYVCVYFERNNDNMQDLLKQILIRWGNVMAACLYSGCINSAHDYLAIKQIRVRFEMSCSHWHSNKYIFRVTYIDCCSAWLKKMWKKEKEKTKRFQH